MSKGVDLPSKSGFYTYIFERGLKAGHLVVNPILVASPGFFFHRLSGVNKLKLAILGKVSDIPHCIIILFGLHIWKNFILT